MNGLAKAVSHCNMISTNSFHRTLEHKAAGGALDLAPTGGGFGSWKEQAQYREGYSLNRGWLYSAVHALSSQGASQPVVVARLKGKKKKTETGRGISSKSFHKAKMSKAVRTKIADQEFVILEDHLVKDMLECPNSFQSRWQFVYSFMANLCLTGWGYIIADVNKGKVELYSLPTTWVKPIHDPTPFASFEVKNPKKASTKPIPLKREQVAFAHLPNPSDPLSAMAPASSQMLAIRIDDHIQTSQEAFFSNGIFPSVIITVGKQPFSDTQGRPVLSGAQRRQLFSAVSREHRGVQNYGKPAIVDGMIEKIDRLSATQNEMGWQRSEDKIRSRILSAFGVPPYVMGESIPGSYAQAFITQEIFYDKINTYLDLLSSILSNFLASLFEEEGLLVWWEEKQAKDPSLQQSLLLAMRSSGDISQNELRAEAGFPPDEDLNQAMIQPAMAVGITQVLTLLGGKQIQTEQAQAMLEGMGISTEMSEKIAGVGLEPPEPPPAPPAAPPPVPPAAEVPPPEEEGMEEAVEELKKSADLLRMSMSSVHVADAILEEVGCRVKHGDHDQSAHGHGGGGGRSAEQKRDLLDKIEGTQGEADLEVRRYARNAKQIGEKLKVAEAKQTIAVAKVESLKKALSASNSKMDALIKMREGIEARIASSKAKLAALKKSKEDDLLKDLEEGEKELKEIVTRMKLMVEELKKIEGELDAAA